MCTRGIDRLIGADSCSRIKNRLHCHIVVKAAVSGIDIERPTAFSMLQAVGRIQFVREQVAKVCVADKTV